MFTDMVAYSSLTQQNEALALELLGEHSKILRALFPKYQGTEIKGTGDGFLVEFASALAAVECAVEIQRTLARRNEAKPLENQIRIRIGIHLGDIVRRDGDAFGDGVNIAARIEPLAEPGGICISNAVYDQIQNKVEHGLLPLKRPELKNIQASIQVYKLLLDGSAPPRRRKISRTVPRSIWQRRSMQLAAGIVLLAAVLVLLKFGPSLRPSAESGPKTIAVLPFKNLNVDQSEESLGDGIAEQVRLALMKVGGLHVAAETSSSTFKGRSEENLLRTIGEQLRVRTVLEGSVQKSGPRLLISAKLINVADGFLLWSQTYDQESQDLIAIQLDVARKVVDELKVQLLPEERERLAKKPTTNVAALELYWKGRFNMYQVTEGGFKQAITLFDQAIAHDPDFALAYAAKVETYAVVGHSWFVPPAEATKLSRAAADRAIELDDSLAEAHFAMALAKVFECNWHGADQQFERSIQLSPRHAPTRNWYGLSLCWRGQPERASAQLQTALKLDPLSAFATATAGWAQFLRRQYDDAIENCRNALALDPNLFLAHEYLACALIQKGDHRQALDALQKAAAVSNRHQEVLGVLGYAHGVAGEKTEARKLLAELNARASSASYACPVYPAMIHTALGETNEALTLLEQASKDRDFNLLVFLKNHPCFDRLHGEPRYSALLKEVGLD